MKVQNKAKTALTIYLVLITLLSLPIYYFAKKSASKDTADLFLSFLMFIPMISAFASSLTTKEKIVWGKPRAKYLLIGFLFPWVVFLTYFIASKFGILTFNNGISWVSILPNVLFGCVLAIGEEIGWRGYVLPILRSKYNFLISNTLLAIIWLVFHLPVIFLGLYGNDSLPLYQQIIFFSMNIFAFSFIVGILWEYSRGVWTATVAHASWNYLLQSVLATTFIATNAWLLGEFGFLPFAGLLIVLIPGLIIYKKYPPKAHNSHQLETK